MLTEHGFAALDYPRIADERGSEQRRAAVAAEAGDRARTQGHAAGFAAGLRAAQRGATKRLAELEAASEARLAEREAHLGELIASVERVLHALRGAVAPVLEDSDDALMRAAIELAEAVVGHGLSAHHASATAALNRVLLELGAEATMPEVTIRMHPDDVAVLRERRELPESLTVRPDGTLNRGDAVAEIPDGLVDARIGTALARAKHALIAESAHER